MKQLKNSFNSALSLQVDISTFDRQSLSQETLKMSKQLKA